MAITLFLSYSKADRDYVALLAARLEQEYSIKAWWFEGKQKGGRDYRQEIISRIAAAHAVIVIVSAASADSPSVVKEIGFARRLKERTVPVIPLVIGPPTSESPFAGMLESGRVLYDIRDLHCINTRDGSDPLPRIMDSLTPDRHSELSFDALDLDPNTPPNHLAGKSIKGYLIDQRVSVTKHSVVFSAVEPSVGRKVAIKVIRPELANQPDYIRRFAEEARRVARLDHPHILKLYTFWRNPSGAYLVMPWMAGGTLEQVRRESPVALPRVARMFAQLAAAVGYAHRHGIIHRDLKPANVLRDSNDNVYLADFSIAQGASQGASGFTPGYAPPEQYQDGAPATPQLDIYSLAIVLFELLTGKLAFDGADRETIYQRQLAGPPALNDLRPDLPLALDAAIRRALDPDPVARFSNVASFAGAIREGFVAALSDSTREPTEILPLLDLVPTTNPYKGLEAFEEDDVLVFFGRDSLTRSLLDQLGAPGVEGRFLAVVGPSGSGKSSVVKAGLLPALRGGALPSSRSWFFATITPGEHLVQNLVAALEQIALMPLGEEAVRRIIADEDGLLAVVHEALPPDSAAELLLLIDQLEELFTLSHDPAFTPLLLKRLAAAVHAPQSRLRIVVTLRGDFYDQALAIAGFGDLLEAHHERVRVLNEQELVQAIIAPAGRMGAQVDSDLLGAIIADMEDQPGALPLLQFTLHRLFEQREGARLTFAAYDQQGGVQGAMANSADRLYASLSKSQQQLARQIFLRLLVLGEDGIATRRRLRQSELRELVRPAEPGPSTAIGTTIPANAHEMPTEDAIAFSTPTEDGTGSPASYTSPLVPQLLANTADLEVVLDRYGKARLLTLDFEPVTREPTVEVAHEALIIGWRRLREEWLKDAQTDLRTRQRLSEAAGEWQHHNYDTAYLERGGFVSRFADLINGGNIALTILERRFVETSLAEREKDEQDERERLERELDLERQRNIEREVSNRRLNRSATLLRAAFIIVLIFALVAGFLGLQAQRNAIDAYSQRQEAIRQNILLRIGELSAQAGAASNQSKQLGALLAVESVMRSWKETQTILPMAKQALQNSSLQIGGQPLWISEGNLLGVQLSRDGDTIIAVEKTGLVLIWNEGLPKSTTPSRRIQTHPQPTLFVINEDASTLFMGYVDGRIDIWNLSEEKATSPVHILQDHQGKITNLAVNASRKVLVSSSTDSTIRIWNLQDVNTNMTSRILAQEKKPVEELELSRDGCVLVVRSNNSNLVTVWNLCQSDPNSSAKTLSAIDDYRGYAVEHIELSADGNSLVTAAYETVKLWDLSSTDPNANVKILRQGPQSPLNGLVFSDNGKTLIGWGADSFVQIWNLNDTNGSINTYTSPTLFGIVRSLVIGENDQLFFAGTDGHGVQVWDSFNRKTYDPILYGSVKQLFLSEESQFLIANVDNDTVWTWQLFISDDSLFNQLSSVDDVHQLTGPLCSAVGRNLSLVEWDQYFPGEVYRRTCPELPDGTGAG